MQNMENGQAWTSAPEKACPALAIPQRAPPWQLQHQHTSAPRPGVHLSNVEGSPPVADAGGCPQARMAADRSDRSRVSDLR